MEQTPRASFIAGPDDPILVTGATGFIGSRLVQTLLDRGFRNVRAFARPSSDVATLDRLARGRDGTRIELITGNLLSRDDCERAVRDVAVIYHLAAGRGEKSVPDAFMNSVVTTRNLLEAALGHARLRRFVSISSFAVYANTDTPRRRWLDESCAVEHRPALRGDAYTFAKVKQDEIVTEYGTTFGIPYVIVRPGYVYGPGNEGITGRVGTGAFGVFLHLGGGNPLPLTYGDNCADAVSYTQILPHDTTQHQV
jgi:nucleoside-diphosphate-sugar epimerase